MTRSTTSSPLVWRLADGNSYDFEYEDADDDQSGDVGIENKYYNAKQIKVDNPEEAIDEFLGVPALEEEKGDWYACCLDSERYTDFLRGFKGLKQAIKLEFKLGRYDDVSVLGLYQ